MNSSRGKENWNLFANNHKSQLQRNEKTIYIYQIINVKLIIFIAKINFIFYLVYFHQWIYGFPNFRIRELIHCLSWQFYNLIWIWNVLISHFIDC